MTQTISPGTLLDLTGRIYFLEVDPSTWTWILVDPGLLLCIKETDMTRAWVRDEAGNSMDALAFASEITDSRRAGSRATGRYEYGADSEPVNELIETGAVKGYTFLTPDGKKFIWVSRYDAETLRLGRMP